MILRLLRQLWHFIRDIFAVFGEALLYDAQMDEWRRQVRRCLVKQTCPRCGREQEYALERHVGARLLAGEYLRDVSCESCGATLRVENLTASGEWARIDRAAHERVFGK